MHIELHLMCSIWLLHLPCHAYLNRTSIILGCALCHDYACVFTMLFASFRLCFFLIVRLRCEVWGFVRPRLFDYFMDSIFFLAGFQARWPLPWISLLSLLASCLDAIAMSRYLPLVCQPPKCHDTTSNLPPSHQTVVWLCYRFAQPLSYSVASCRCSFRLFHVGTWISWDITISRI